MSQFVRGSMWIRQTTRWAVYLRDDLRCVFCMRTAADIVRGPDTNFLTLDHIRGRSGVPGEHLPENLVTACYECNIERGMQSLRSWCVSRGWSYAAVRSRAFKARAEGIERYREAAKLILGLVSGVPRADLVSIMAWRARRQWAGWQERLEWAQDLETCDKCHRKINDPGDFHEEAREEQVPF